MKKNLFSTMLALLTIVAMLVSVGCKNYDDDISDINKKLSTMDGSISSVQSQVTTLQSTVTSLQSALDQVKADVAKCANEDDLANLQAQITILTAAIDECNTAIEANKAAIEQNGKDIVAGDQANKDYADATFATIGALADANAAIKSLESTVATLGDDFKALIEAAEKAHDDLSKTISEIQSQIDKIKEALAQYYTAEQIEARIAEIYSSLGFSSVALNTAINIGYGQYNGIFDKNGKATTWNGPRKDEIAALAKGSYIAASDVKYVVVTVNPANADLTKAELSIQTMYGDKAPLVFSTPYRYEDVYTKAASGKWVVPFVVGEITSDFVNGYTKTWANKQASLVVNDAVRGNYGSKYFSAAEYGTDEAVSSFTKIYPYATAMAAEGLYIATTNIEDAAKVFDINITGCTSRYDSLQCGVKCYGDYFTFDKAAVEKAGLPHTFTFDIEYLNVRGWVRTAKATVTIEAAIPEDAKIVNHTTSYADTAKHSATPIVKNQNFNVSMADAYKAWGVSDPTSADGIRYNKYVEIGKATVSAIYVPTDDPSVTQNVSALLGSTASIDTKTGVATVAFTEDYPLIDNVDLLGKTFQMTLKQTGLYTDVNEKHNFSVTLPVTIIAPTAADVAKWYSWNALQTTVDNTIKIYASDVYATPRASVYVSDHFKVEAGYEGVVELYAGYTENEEIPRVYPKVTAPAVETPIYKEAVKLMSDEDKAAAKEILTENVTVGYTDVVRVEEEDVKKWAIQTMSSVENYERVLFTVNSGQLFIGSDYIIDDVLDQTYTINGLKVKAMDREYNAPVKVKVENPYPGKSTVIWDPSYVSLDVSEMIGGAYSFKAANTVDPEPASDYDGTFTLRTGSGKKVKIKSVSEYFCNTQKLWKVAMDGSLVDLPMTGKIIKGFEYKDDDETTHYGLEVVMSSDNFANVQPGDKFVVDFGLWADDLVDVDGNAIDRGTMEELYVTIVVE